MGATYFVVLDSDDSGQNPGAVKAPDAVLYDLETMTTVLIEAKERGLKWHLQVDF